MAAHIQSIGEAMYDTREMLRTRRFSTHRFGAEDVISQLRQENFTGNITLHMSQGTVSSIVAEDRSRLAIPAANNNCA